MACFYVKQIRGKRKIVISSTDRLATRLSDAPRRPAQVSCQRLGAPCVQLSYLRQRGHSTSVSPICQRYEKVSHPWDISDMLQLTYTCFGGTKAIRGILRAPGLKLLQQGKKSHRHCTHPLKYEGRLRTKPRWALGGLGRPGYSIMPKYDLIVTLYHGIVPNTALAWELTLV